MRQSKFFHFLSDFPTLILFPPKPSGSLIFNESYGKPAVVPPSIPFWSSKPFVKTNVKSRWINCSGLVCKIFRVWKRSHSTVAELLANGANHSSISSLDCI